MSLNPMISNQNFSWNYSKPEKEGYSTKLVGTVLSLQEVQKRAWSPDGRPGPGLKWPDGNPMMNHRLTLATPEGAIKTFTYQPAGKAQRQGLKPSVHMDLYALTGNTDMVNLIGKTISIETVEGRYGQGNPRPWKVALVDGGPYEPALPLPVEFTVPAVYANDAVSGGQFQPAQMQQGYAPQQMPQQMPQGYWPQQQSQPQYQGMDPSIQAAMQQMGATVTEIPQPNPVYGQPYGNDEIPF